MRTTKANSMLRRFFSRFGGASVDASGFKRTMGVNPDNDEGGDTPSAAKFTLDSIRLKSREDLITFFDSLEWVSEEGSESYQYVNDPINIKELFVRDDFDFWEFAMEQDINRDGLHIEIASIPVGNGEDGSVTAHFGIIEGLMPPAPALEIDFLRNNQIVSKVFCRMFPNEQEEYEAYLERRIMLG